MKEFKMQTCMSAHDLCLYECFENYCVSFSFLGGVVLSVGLKKKLNLYIRIRKLCNYLHCTTFSKHFKFTDTLLY